MFVRICYGEDYDALYECERMHRRPLKGEGGATLPDKFDLDLESKDGSVTIQIDKDNNTRIYVMNQRGQTIDSYSY